MSSSEKTGSNASVACKQFAFRPSKLTEVAEKIWKKETSNTSVEKPQTTLSLVEKPKFACASSPESKSREISASSTTKPFVFGQNIKQRVVVSEEASSSNPPLNDQLNDYKSDTKVDDFKAVCQTEKESKQQSASQENGTGVSLEQSAEKYEKIKCENSRVKLAENIEVKTGEEEEFNILQVSCKLHVYDNAKQTWEERGHAVFRLNEDSKSDEDERARIVVRLQGSLKVVINSRLWDKMLLEKVTPKRLKLSAVDATDKTVVLYLISGTQCDIDKIEHEINLRLNDLKQQSSQQNSATSVKRPNTELDDKTKSDEKKSKTVH